MKQTTAITVEGVLRKPSSGQVIDFGKSLYYGLSLQSVIVLLSDGKKEETEHFLALEGMHEHIAVLYPDSVGRVLDGPDARLAQVVNSGRMYAIDFVVDSDPAVAELLIMNGINCLLFCHAQYARPEWRPGYEFTPTPWESLSQQIATEAHLKATDARLEGR
jgi:hypothetical protein